MRCGLTLAVGVGPESFGLSHHQVLATGFGGGQDGQLERLGTDADALLLAMIRSAVEAVAMSIMGWVPLTLIEYTMAGTNQPVLVQFADCPRVDQKFGL